MKKTKLFLRWGVIFLLIALLFFWAIWNAFLVDFVPWKRTLFFNEESFFEMSKGGSFFSKELPSTAYDTEYYIGNRYFVRINGYGTSVSEMEYEQFKEEMLQRYRYQYDELGEMPTQYIYLYDDNETIKWITTDYTTKYDINELEELILADEKMGDYYILTSYEYNGGPINYYNWVLCNDVNCRIIEISKTDRNPQ